MSSIKGLSLIEYFVYKIDRLVFSPADDFGINLRVLYLGMPQQLGNGIKVCTEREQHCGEGVAACVIGHRLGYSGIGSPCFQDVIDAGVSGQMLEDKAAGIVFSAVLASGNPSSCLHAERYMHLFFALVHDDGQYPPAVVLRDVAPSEFADIVEPQAAVAGEQVGIPHRLVFAGRGNQPFHFVYRQIVSLPSASLGSLVTGKQVHWVCRDDSFAHGNIQGSHERALAVKDGLGLEIFPFGCLVSSLQVFHKSDAELLADVPDLCVATAHVGENAA